jgi:hypothetical protein
MIKVKTIAMHQAPQHLLVKKFNPLIVIRNSVLKIREKLISF